MSTWARKKRAQERMLEMSAMTNPNLFYYKGGIEGFQMKLNQLMNNPNAQVTDVHVVIHGDQTKQPNRCCCVLTGILACLFLIPFVVMCFDWWNKIVQPAFQIPLTVYQNLRVLIQRPTIKSVNLQVKDSSFEQEKAKLLFDLLSISQVKDFTFFNTAPNLDYKEREYSDFFQYMKPIKMLPMKTYLRWYNDVVA